jgi:STE24 endopeptidase
MSACALLLLLAATPAASTAPATPPDAAFHIQDVDLAQHFSPAERRRANQYAARQRRVHHLGYLLDALLFALFLVPLIARRLRSACDRGAARLGARWPARQPGAVFARILGEGWAGGLLLALAFLLAGTLVSLPLALWQESLARDIGLSTYTARAWAWDTVKGLAQHVVVFACLVIGVYGLIRRFPHRWWLVVGVPAAAVLVGYGVVEPHLPRVYHEMQPLRSVDHPGAERLRARLAALTRQAGLRLDRVSVIRTSRTSRAWNAQVVGLGPTRSIVLTDTLLAEASDAEIAVAVAHELGHEQRRRDVVTYGLAALALLGLLALLARVLRAGARGLGLRGADDLGTLPLLAAAVWLVFLVSQPLFAWRSRVEERAADRAALTLTGDPDAFVRLHVALARQNRLELDPPAWVVHLTAGYPTVRQRLGLAQGYRTWLRQRADTVRDSAAPRE